MRSSAFASALSWMLLSGKEAALIKPAASGGSSGSNGLRLLLLLPLPVIELLLRSADKPSSVRDCSFCWLEPGLSCEHCCCCCCCCELLCCFALCQTNSSDSS